MARSGLIDQPVHPLPVQRPVVDPLEAQAVPGLPGAEEPIPRFPGDGSWRAFQYLKIEYLRGGAKLIHFEISAFLGLHSTCELLLRVEKLLLARHPFDPDELEWEAIPGNQQRVANLSGLVP